MLWCLYSAILFYYHTWGGNFPQCGSKIGIISWGSPSKWEAPDKLILNYLKDCETRYCVYILLGIFLYDMDGVETWLYNECVRHMATYEYVV